MLRYEKKKKKLKRGFNNTATRTGNENNGTTLKQMQMQTKHLHRASGIEVNNYNFSPRAGLFISDLTSLGVQLGYTNSKFGGSTNKAFEVGVYSRFHKLVTDNFYLFYQPSLSLRLEDNEASNGANVDSNSINIGFSPGVTYFFSPKLAVEATVGRAYFSRDYTNDTSDYGIGLDFDSISFGFSYYFR